MKKIFHILLLSFFVISCSSDNDEPSLGVEPTEELEGKQVFRIDLKELIAKSDVVSQKQLEPAFALVSINDSDGAPVLNREKVVLTKKDESYITTEITLDVGTYSLIEFIVTDADNVVISVAPKENSALAQFATKTLPFDFLVVSDETKETVTENINAAGYTSVDFGYLGLSLTFPENTNFFILTVDDSNSLTTNSLNLKSITGSTYFVDWGDGVIDEYVSTISDSGIENTISHTYTENGIYTITVSGSVEAIELLDFTSNDPENNNQSHLTSIDITKLTLLKSCQLFSGNLTSLNTSENKALEFLGIGYNQVSSLDFSNNTNLKTVWLRYNQLTTLDLSQNPKMEFLSVEGNQISTLNLSGNPKLKVILARENELSSIDFSNNMELERFDVANNAISTIDISQNITLKEINVGANNLNSIDLSKNINLVRIDLYTNQLTNINLAANLKLRDLYIDNNLLTEIDLSVNPLLERLIIGNNNLTTLDISGNSKIFDLQIESNQFNGTNLDQIISQIYDQTVLNSVSNGFINYADNPGTDNLSNITIAQLNELFLDYNWFFIGN